MEEFYHSMDRPPFSENTLSLTARLEALLFTASGPVSSASLAAALELPLEVVEQGLLDLEAAFREAGENAGLRIQRHAGRVQLTTAPQAAGVVERFLGLEATSRLSRAALEALAIVAYQRPVTRPQIDAIRGVSSDGVLKSLLSKGLIQEIGRAESPGRPILFDITEDFLQYFGLDSLEQLPPLFPPESTPEPAQQRDEILKG